MMDNISIPWSRNNHVLVTRLLPQVMTVINNFSPEPWKRQTEAMVNQVPSDHWNTPVTGTV
jgi:hypothetical protein